MKAIVNGIIRLTSATIPVLVIVICVLGTVQAQWVRTNGPYGGRVNSFVSLSGNLFAGTGGGVYTSSNNGNTWTSASSGLTTSYVWTLAVKSGNIFAGTLGGGVFVSPDNGGSWTAVNNGLTETIVNILAVNGSNIFAGTPGGIFLSTNSGSSWSAVNTGLGAIEVFSIAFNGTNIFAATAGSGIFLSTNNGNSWTAVNTGLTDLNVNSLVVNGSNIFAATDAGVFLSTNNGSNWTAKTTGLTNLSNAFFAISGANIFVGSYQTGGGVFLSSNNGNSWTSVNTGLESTDLSIYSLFANGGDIFVGTNRGGAFLSSNNGANWTAINNGLAATAISALAFNGTTLFAGTLGTGVFSSSDNGSTWVQGIAGMPNLTIRALLVNGINLFAGTGGGGVFLSTNNGANWSAVNTGLTNQAIRAFAINGTNLFVGTNGGGVFLSTNNGSSWSAVITGLSNLNIQTLALNGSNLFAGTTNGIYFSSNNGSSWSAVNTGLSDLNVLTITSSGSNLFAGTAGGVYKSTNNGGSWALVNSGLTNLDVRALAVVGGYILAGTNGGGVFISANNGTTWTTVNAGLTNPFVSSLAISGSNVLAGTIFGGVFLGTLSAFTDTTPPVVSAVNTAASVAPGTGLLVSANFTDAESGIASASVLYRPVAGVSPNNFVTLPMTKTAGSTYQATIPGSAITELGVEYKYLGVNVTNLDNTATQTLYNATVRQAGGLEIKSYPGSAAGNQAVNYRIIATPLVLDNKTVNDVFNDFLGGYDPTAYRMFRYNGTRYDELNSSSVLVPGEGYWFICVSSSPLRTGPGTTVDVNSANPFTITLSPGWNQIGNPYNFSISWAEVVAANPTQAANLGGNTSKIRIFRGSVENVDVIKPLEGGFVKFLGSSATPIKIPVNKNSTIQGRINAPDYSKNSLDDPSWELFFNVKNGMTEYSLGGIGMHPEAKEEFDYHDDFNAPRFMDYLEVKFPKKYFGMTYTKDVVPTAENHVWNFVVETNLKEKLTTLRWDNSNFNTTKGVYLLDVTLHKVTDMTAENHYQYDQTAGSSFKVILGHPDFVKKELTPEKIFLFDPYPNPFNETVNINYDLPSEVRNSEAIIDIYNLQGSKVASVVSQEPGLGSWSWSSDQHSPGLYFVRLRTGNQQVTKKLIKQ